MYEGDYITSGTNGLILVPSPADVFDIKDLNVGNLNRSNALALLARSKACDRLQPRRER